MADEKLVNITQEAIEMAQKTLEINKSETEPKKRGRTPLTEQEKAERAKIKELQKRNKITEKAQEQENARIEKELGYSPSSFADMENCISIVLTKEFIAKCKKEKISSDDYETIIFALCRKWVNGEIEIKKRIKTEYY